VGDQIGTRAPGSRPQPGALRNIHGNGRLWRRNTVKTSTTRAKLERLREETAAEHKHVLITGRRSNGVLIGEKDWNAIQETLSLLSVPGMCESIREGVATPLEECEKEPD
jgi:PHD/YefM family antitoxin component YafN of YafNO toxin-antitoxin module